METSINRFRYIRIRGFKSYYVVWKLKYIITDKEKKKSLNRTMQYGNEKRLGEILKEREFKSYYVVWKPIIPSPSKIKGFGLNRTMQYGNELVSHHRSSRHENV